MIKPAKYEQLRNKYNAALTELLNLESRHRTERLLMLELARFTLFGCHGITPELNRERYYMCNKIIKEMAGHTADAETNGSSDSHG